MICQSCKREKLSLAKCPHCGWNTTPLATTGHTGTVAVFDRSKDPPRQQSAFIPDGINARLEIDLGEVRSPSGNRLWFRCFVDPSNRVELHAYAIDSDSRRSGVYMVLDRHNLVELESIIEQAKKIYAKCGR